MRDSKDRCINPEDEIERWEKGLRDLFKLYEIYDRMSHLSGIIGRYAEERRLFMWSRMETHVEHLYELNTKSVEGRLENENTV